MSDSRPLISAIITTHNRKELVRQAIESVLNQVPCGEAVEVIVVDDNSSDGTREVIAEYDRARYLRAHEGTPAGTRNVGIAGSAGSWLAFLDDDDVWLPQKLQVFVAALRNTPEARVFFSTAYICDHNLTRGPLWLGPQDLDTSTMYASVVLGVVTPSVTMIHREVFERVGLFDPKAFRAEDRDLLARAARAGFRFGRIAEPLVLYRGREELDGAQLETTLRTSLMVLRRELAIRHHARPPWLQRQIVRLKVRGWYADQLLKAARQERARGKRMHAHSLSWAALKASPAHWLRLQLGSLRSE
jgi:glycosyltransferase involved in cell wall biosynthesis